MSNVVDLLERLGQSSRARTLSDEQLAQELSRAGIDPAVRAAILEQRAHQLEELIGASKNVCCLVHAPQDDEPEEEQPKDDDEKITHFDAVAGVDRRVARAG